jgi:N-acetylneuraminic acid mutarotase
MESGTVLHVVAVVVLYVAYQVQVIGKEVKQCTGPPAAPQNPLIKSHSWERIHPVGRQPPPRLAHAAVGIAHAMYIFGGFYGSKPLGIPLTYYNDLWIYDERTDAWELISARGDIPKPRLHHSLVSSDDNTLILFGGFNSFMGEEGHGSFNDVHLFDIPSRTWTRVDVEGESPLPRGSHEAVWMNQAMYVFGGFAKIGPAGHLQELWRFEPSRKRWQQLTMQGAPQNEASTATVPEGRIGFPWVVHNGEAYMFAGGCPTGECDDIWRYDPRSNLWTHLPSPSGMKPSPRRASHGDVAVGGIVYQTGGMSIKGPADVEVFDDLWAFDPESNFWMPLFPNFNRGPKPNKTFGHTAVRLGQRIVIYGGRVGSPANPGSQDLWELTAEIPED